MSRSGAARSASPYEALEFGKVVGLLRRYVSSPLGEARLERLLAQPRMDSASSAGEELRAAGEAMEWLQGPVEPGRPEPPSFSGLGDVRESVGRLATEGAALDASEIAALLDVLEASQRIRDALLRDGDERPALHARGEAVPDMRLLVRQLAGKILPSGEVASLASTALSKIRRQLERQRQAVESSLNRFVRKHADSDRLRERYVTMRNGRTVVPVKANWKSRVDGIVHGASSSGQTVFVEPLDTIVQNNRLVRLREEEQAEVLRILREMSAALRAEREAIAAATDAVSDAECVFARARFGLAFGCCLPRFNAPVEPRIVLEGARHPLLQDILAAEGEAPVPMSLVLESGARTLIVSGPNAGGKTVVLKTVGVLATMAQAGIPVPAEAAEFPWFERILADIGDAQSISESLSTFSAHVATLSSILDRAGPGTLVVLDELGTATDPEDGGALAVAVVERLMAAGGFVLVSTHLPELRMHGASAAGAVSASMGFDERTLGVTYQFHCGVPGQSAGLEMAERFGMPAAVIRRAREAKGRSEERSAHYLAELRRQAGEYEGLLRDARRKERELESRRAELERDAEQRARSLREETERRIEQLVQKLEERFRDALAKALAAIRPSARSERSLERKAADSIASYRRTVNAEVRAALGAAAERIAPADEQFAPGDRVHVASMGVSGEITRKLDSGRWEVRAGTLRLQASGEDLVPDDGESDPPVRLPEGVRLEAGFEPGELPAEINVIGKTADEALPDVDRFLDRAVLANRTRLRVIHGFGKDVLRRELWQMFAGHSHVAKYYQAEQHEGGAGATIVEIRDG